MCSNTFSHHLDTFNFIYEILNCMKFNPFLSLFFHIQRDRVRVTMHFSHIKKSFLKNDFDSSKLERGFNMDKI